MAKSLHQFESAVRAIPPSKLSIEHHFYAYQRELGQLMNWTVYASLAVGQKDYDTAVSLLRTAVRLQDSFSYMEPENFYYPTRQCLGAVMLLRLLLTQQTGHDYDIMKSEIKEIYADDLRVHPNNHWTLRALRQLNDLPTTSSAASLALLAERQDDKHDYESPWSCCELGLC